jgi:hypothetical protein
MKNLLETLRFAQSDSLPLINNLVLGCYIRPVQFECLCQPMDKGGTALLQPRWRGFVSRLILA